MASSLVKENNFLRPSILTLNITKQPSKVSTHLETVSLLRLLKEYSRPSKDLNNYLDPNSDFNTTGIKTISKILSYT